MTAPTARAVLRALAVLVVVLGLLAMHGIAGTHHAAAAATPAAHGAVQHQAAPQAAHQHAAHRAVEDADVLAAPDRSSCDDCWDIGALCVAVLAGAALAMLLAHRRSSPLLRAVARPRGPTRAPPGRLVPGPDPVKEICVSRT